MAYNSWEEEFVAQQAELEMLRKQNMAAREAPAGATGSASSQLNSFGQFDPAKAGQAGARGPLSLMGGKWGYYQWDANGAPSFVNVNPANRAEDDAFSAMSNMEQGSVPVYDPATGQMRGTNASLGYSNQNTVFGSAVPYMPSWWSQGGQPTSSAQQPAPQQTTAPQGGGLLSSSFRPQTGTPAGSAGGMAGAGGSGNSFSGSAAGLGGALGQFTGGYTGGAAGQGGGRNTFGFSPFNGMNPFFQNYWGK